MRYEFGHSELSEVDNYCQMLKQIYDLYKCNIAVKYRKGEKIEEISYLTLIENICSIYNYYKRNKIYNTNIGIISENRYEYIPIYLGTVFSNVIAPLDKEYSEGDLLEMIKKFDIEILFCTNKTKPKVEKAIGGQVFKIVNIDDEFEDIVSEKYSIDEMFREVSCVSGDKFSTLAFASGTCGVVKGVMLSQKNIVLNLYDAHKKNIINGSALLLLPFNHTYCFNCGVLIALFKGITMCINMDLRDLFKDIKEYDPYCMVVVPGVAEGIYKSVLTHIRMDRKEKLFGTLLKLSNFLLKFKIDIRHLLFGNILSKSLRLLVSGGASLDPSYVYKYRELGIELLNGYGMTECSPLVSVCMDKFNVVGSCGVILDKISVKIADDGEILVKGPNVMLGYYNDKETTKKSMVDGYYKTGDLGYKNGNVLYVVGRKNNLIVLPNGKKFSPETVENRLMQLGYVKECLVLCQKGTSKILAKVLLDNRLHKDFDKDIAEINSTLPYYMRIDDYEIVDREFDKTTTKKIIRRKYDR